MGSQSLRESRLAGRTCGAGDSCEVEGGLPMGSQSLRESRLGGPVAQETEVRWREAPHGLTVSEGALASWADL